MRWLLPFLLLLIGGHAAAQDVDVHRLPLFRRGGQQHNQTPNCAAPSGITGPASEVSAAEFHDLRVQVQTMYHGLKNGQYRGPQGPQGPPGPAGESHGPLIKQLHTWLSHVEERLTKAEYKISSIDGSGTSDGGSDPPKVPPISRPSAPPQTTGEGQTSWFKSVAKTVATGAGTSVAGPVGGLISGACVSGLFWFMGRKKKV